LSGALSENDSGTLAVENWGRGGSGRTVVFAGLAGTSVALSIEDAFVGTSDECTALVTQHPKKSTSSSSKP